MAKKQEIKNSESRILIYLQQVPDNKKYRSMIQRKLGIGQAYLGVLLNEMIEKGWLVKHAYRNKVFYDLSGNSPIDKFPVDTQEE